MTEAEAQAWIVEYFGLEAHGRLAHLVALVSQEAATQNLIAASTIDRMWSRHVVDSAQLAQFVGYDLSDGLWLDIGAGAGFPGLVVAALRTAPMLLVEPRRKRADFLVRAVAALGLGGHCSVACAAVQTIGETARVISARAVASLGQILASSAHCAGPATLWVLPKGRNAREEVAAAQKAWHGMFHVEQSITDPHSLIVFASGVSRR